MRKLEAAWAVNKARPPAPDDSTALHTAVGVAATTLPLQAELARVSTEWPASLPRHLLSSSQPQGRIPIHAVSASGLLEDRQACTASGMDGVLPKPLTPQGLKALLKPIVARKTAVLNLRGRLSSAPPVLLQNSLQFLPAASLISDAAPAQDADQIALPACASSTFTSSTFLANASSAWCDCSDVLLAR
jgi:CheY-like chemotaxis protein